MKNIILKSFVFAMLLGSFVSCDDFFEIKRPQETQWTNTATFEQGLNSAYWLIQWGNGLGRDILYYMIFQLKEQLVKQ